MVARSRIRDALLAHFKKHQGLTRAEFARQLGIDTRTLMRLLSGKVRAPKTATLKSLASKLGLSADNLLGLE